MDPIATRPVFLRDQNRSQHRKKMATAKISSKYQIVIPKEIREAAGLRTGQTVEVLLRDGMICLVPHQPLSSVRGLVRGASTDGYRDKDDRA